MFKLIRRNRKGFTLIELIVVIAILAILVAIAIPTFTGFTTEANNKVNLANGRSIATAINAYNSMETVAANKLDGGSTMAEVKAAVGALWPTGIADEATAFGMISYTNGVALVSETASPSPT